MRLSLNQPLIYSLVLLPSLSAAITLDCERVTIGGHKYDFSALKGPRSVTVIKDTPPTIKNTTYTIDLCAPLKRHKNVPAEDECHGGARVCGITTSHNTADDKSVIDEVIDIAGDYTTSAGASRALDPLKTRLKSSDSEADGVRLELHGGRHPWSGKGARKQQAVIELICDPDRTGLEGFTDAPKRRERRADEEEDQPEKSLTFKSYGAVDDIDVLRLNWLTKYACEDAAIGDGDSDKSSHWGFFTWFIVIAFLGIAAYLIFGSWLNYNRYGARGWDLLPHGDTIRDIPYLFKDWMRRVINTIQGPGSRGGYSAV